ncbi:MAG: 23S rRNA pseudouridine1911/1915/1917 synthase [Octadecabacter sp.]|jgi:23S rRNA pseudouridine1911/1915/1917 synthase
MSATTVLFNLAEKPPVRMDKALALNVPLDASLSRSRLMRLLAEGAVKINGVVVTDPRAKPVEGDTVEILVEIADDYHVLPENIPLDVVFEDDDLIVINKPTGMVVHPAPGTPGSTLVNALLHHCGDALSGVGGEKRPGIVHRIDKETSGLLVVAKTDRAHHGLAAQFEAHTVERHYRAICYGVPDSNDPRVRGIKGASFEPGNILKLQTQLARHKHDRQKQAVIWHNGRHAVTRARVVQQLGNPAVAAVMDCWLETGRTHQIRVHLTHAGHGLIGDPTYGGRRKLSEKVVGEAGRVAAYTFPRQALHAATLGFRHPVSKKMLRFEAPMPSDMVDLIAALGGTQG